MSNNVYRIFPQVAIRNTTVTSSTSTGALVVSGGLGIAGSVYAGNIYSNGSLISSGINYIAGTNVSIGSGIISVVNNPIFSGGLTSAGLTSTAGVVATTGNFSGAITHGALSGTSGLFSGAITSAGLTSTAGLVATTGNFSGVTTVSSTTASTNTTTGALVVSGGLAVATDIRLGGNSFTGGIRTDNNPTFRVFMSTNQTVSAVSSNMVQFNSITYDTAGYFNTSTYRFTPTVSGYYYVSAFIEFAANTGLSSLTLVKNGSDRISSNGAFTGPTYTFCISCSSVVFVNGTTDYLQVYGFSSGGSTIFGGSDASNSFNGYFLRR